jgi:uncharacterized repeat protein (TIGR01451 family)
MSKRKPTFFWHISTVAFALSLIAATARAQAPSSDLPTFPGEPEPPAATAPAKPAAPKRADKVAPLPPDDPGAVDALPKPGEALDIPKPVPVPTPKSEPVKPATGEASAAKPAATPIPAVAAPAQAEAPPAQPSTGRRIPTFDREAMPASNNQPPDPDGEKNPLPAAVQKAGEPAPPAGEPRVVDPLVPHTDQIPAGPQSVSMTVSVVAPEVMNVGQKSSLKILIRNTGVADARAVRLHYDLPPELELIEAQPLQKVVDPADRKLFWTLDTVAAGSEQLILLKVKATKPNTIDHAALVTMVVGSRSRTVVQQPLLKVEQTVSPSKLLKGQQAQFAITVSNPGTGPARNVVVRAMMSSGLKADGEDVVEQVIPILQPGQPVTLDPLIVDTIAGGEQTCTVVVTSPDVHQDKDEKVVRSVIVLHPELNIKIAGPETRFTDTYADYKIIATNPGTAAARDVRVTISLPPNSGKLQKPLPPGSEWNSAKSTLTVTIPKIEPKTGDKPGEASVAFSVLLGGPGAYRVNADARAGDLFSKDAMNTSVTGIADLEMNITERRRVLDVGESTIFYVKMRNTGTKAAKKVLLTAVLSANLEVTDTAGLEQEARPGEKPGEVLFPQIDTIEPGKTLDISIRAKALKAGVATCRVFLMHDDLPDPSTKIEDIAHTRVTESRLK